MNGTPSLIFANCLYIMSAMSLRCSVAVTHPKSHNSWHLCFAFHPSIGTALTTTVNLLTLLEMDANGVGMLLRYISKVWRVCFCCAQQYTAIAASQITSFYSNTCRVETTRLLVYVPHLRDTGFPCGPSHSLWLCDSADNSISILCWWITAYLNIKSDTFLHQGVHRRAKKAPFSCYCRHSMRSFATPTLLACRAHARRQ